MNLVPGTLQTGTQNSYRHVLEYGFGLKKHGLQTFVDQGTHQEKVYGYLPFVLNFSPLQKTVCNQVQGMERAKLGKSHFQR